MTDRTILDLLASLPLETRERLEAAIGQAEDAARLQGYILARLALTMWLWRYCGIGADAWPDA